MECFLCLYPSGIFPLRWAGMADLFFPWGNHLWNPLHTYLHNLGGSKCQQESCPRLYSDCSFFIDCLKTTNRLLPPLHSKKIILSRCYVGDSELYVSFRKCLHLWLLCVYLLTMGCTLQLPYVHALLLMINALYLTIHCHMILCGGLRVATISLCG